MSLISMQSFLLMMIRKLTLLCSQACHLVEKFNLQILFVVQGNGKRRICNVEKNGRSLDSSRIRSSLSMFYVPVLQYQKYLLTLLTPRLHEKIATQATVPAEVLCETV